MHRLAVLAMLAACGRIGFEARRGGDGGPGDGSGATCAWAAGCAFPEITCCTPAGPVCSTQASCTDPILKCNLQPGNEGCQSGETCCDLGLGAGRMCFGSPQPC